MPSRLRIQAIGAVRQRLDARGWKHAIARATVFELGPVRTSRVGRSCLCTGSIRSSRMALLLLVRGERGGDKVCTFGCSRLQALSFNGEISIAG